MEGFTPATAAGSAPIAIYNNVTPNDPGAVLDGEPLRRMASLHQRAQDIFATVPLFEDVAEVRTTKVHHENRIAELMRPRSEGGFGEPEDAGVVRSERAKLKRASAELHRLETLKQIRTRRWTACSQLERAVTDWLLRGGIPGGCRIEAVPDAPLDALLIKDDRNRIDVALDRYRNRLRELAADLHKVRCAPWPSSAAKAAAKIQIEQLAAAAAPDCARAIAAGLPVSFPTTMLSSMVRAETPALAFAETPDAFGTLCWALKDQMLEKIFAALDQVSDDKAALSQEQREQMEATIISDMLAVERSECALIWHAESDGEVFDFRPDTSPLAVLGLTLVTAPGVAALPGTSAGYAFDIVSGRRR